MQQGDDNKQTQFWTTAKASFIEENVTQKFTVLLGRPPYEGYTRPRLERVYQNTTFKTEQLSTLTDGYNVNR